MDGSWVPSTPGKLICTDRQENGLNCFLSQITPQGNQKCNGSKLELERFPGAFREETHSQNVAAPCESTDSVNMSRHFNSFREANSSDADKWNGLSCSDLLAFASVAVGETDRNTTTNFLNAIVDSQFERDYFEKLPANSSSLGKDLLFGTKCRSNSDHVSEMPYNGSHILRTHAFDLNSPPRMSVLSSRECIQYQLEPITPDQAARVFKQQVFSVPSTSITETRDIQEKELTVGSAEPNQLMQKEQSRLLVDQLSAGISTELQENHAPEEGGTQGSDSNRTPQQKPRRKKHRPKVVIEGKPKRKYVHRNGGNKLTDTPSEKLTDGTGSTVKAPGSEQMPVGKRKYVRRKGLATHTEKGTDGTASMMEPSGSAQMPVGKRKYVIRKEPDTPTDKGNDGTASKMESTCSKETPLGKRQYTRRKGVQNVVTMPMPLEDGTSRPSLQARSSCRRSLNFDSQDQVINNSSSGTSSNLDNVTTAKNFGGQDHLRNTVFQQAMEARIGKPEVGMACNYTCSVNQMSESDTLNSDRQGSAFSTAHKNQQPHHESAEVHANEYASGKSQIVHSRGVNFVQMMSTDGQCLRSPSSPNCNSNTCLTQETQAIGSKRQCLSMNEAELCSRNVTGAHNTSLQTYFPIFSPNECITGRAPIGYFPVIHKKRRTEKGHRLTCRDESSGATARRPFNHVHEQLYTSESSHRVLSTQHDYSSAITNEALVHCGAQEKQNFDCLLAVTDSRRSTKKRSKGPTRARSFLHESYQQLLTLSREPTKTRGVIHQPHGCMESTLQNHASVTKRKRSKRNSLIAPPLAITWKAMSLIDQMIDHFRRLDINGLNSQLEYHGQNALTSYQMHYPEQNALVVYQRDGSIVPFNDSFVPRKRKPRPKVDLDDETSRVWRLLLEDINSEGIDGTDEEKAKWWEEERKVFRGRADSFIARMHLVQGDRRFSPWKGSVLDSVIGVFLTQNVSDHLSSSAFMSLAAQYPLKPKGKHKESQEEQTCIIEEPELHVPDPDDAIAWLEENSNLSSSGQGSITQPFREDDREKVADSPEVLQSRPCGTKSVDNSTGQVTDSSKDTSDHYHEPAINGSDTEISQPLASSVRHQRELDHILSSRYSVGSTVAQTENFELSSLALFKEETTETKTTPFTGSTSFVELLNGVCSRGSRNGSFSMCPSSQSERDLCATENTDCSNDAEASVSNFTRSNFSLHVIHNSGSQSSGCSDKEISATESSGLSAESANETTIKKTIAVTFEEVPKFSNENENLRNNQQIEMRLNTVGDPEINVKSQIQLQEDNYKEQQALDSSTLFLGTSAVTERSVVTENSGDHRGKTVQSSLNACHDHLDITINADDASTSKVKRGGSGKQKQDVVDWDCLRKEAETNGKKKERTADTMDSLDWEAIRHADVKEIADTIKARGMNNRLAERIKDLLDRLVREHGSTDLEWLRDVPPDKAKEYLLSIRGLGLKSVECVRLLTLHHLAFPVDTNVGRIAVRLGWVPLQPLPESLQLHLLELYPVLESIQKYLWPRLCKLDQRTLYELHYQMITFGKVFCTKSKPNCNACPMRGECRHFASAFASARLALPGPEEKNIVMATENQAADQKSAEISSTNLCLPQADEQNSVGIPSSSNALAEYNKQLTAHSESSSSNPIVVIPATPEPTVEEPSTPEPEQAVASAPDIEELDDPDEIPTIKLNMEEFTQNLQMFVGNNTELQEHEMSKALVALTAQAASIPVPKLKNIRRLRTEHHVYELPDSHPLLQGLDLREPDDPCPYLLAIWTPGETADSVQPPERTCNSKESGRLCDEETCFSCNSIREANSQTVRGTLLIPCRTAMRGSFPLNGTYFQVNEVFADHESSLNPIDVPRTWIWNLPRRTVYFGTSVPTIFKGLSTEEIQYCFWRGFVCVRGFEQKTRAPRPLIARLHFPASYTKTKGRMDVNKKMQSQ